VKSDLVLPSVSDLAEIGESELENPLPWDTIAPADYVPLQRVAPYLAALQKNSAARLSRDPELRQWQEEIARQKKLREDKTISLNEAERRQEKAENEARAQARKAERQAHPVTPPPTWDITVRDAERAGLGEPLKTVKPLGSNLFALSSSSKDDGGATPGDDLLLKETEHILSDYISLLGAGAPEVARR
jgi:carboxyl-terminal processing protease